MAEDADILLCHPARHLERIIGMAPVGRSVALDADTHMSAGSLNAARRAVGGNIAAVDAVLSGEAGNAFVATRPPGKTASTAAILPPTARRAAFKDPADICVSASKATDLLTGAMPTMRSR